MNLAPFEIPASWRRDGCTEKCWQRFVQIEAGRRRQVLTYHDLGGHERAWIVAQHRDVVVTGPLVIDPQRAIASVDGRDIDLTPTEYKILYCLSLRVGEVRQAAEVLDFVWGAASIYDTSLLRTNVNRMRIRLGPASPLVVTRVSVGYMLRDLPPCASADLTPESPPLMYIRSDPVARPYRIGIRQTLILRALHLAPGHRLSFEHVTVEAWGSLKRKRLFDCHKSVQLLEANGYPVTFERSPDSGRGWVWLTGPLPDEEMQP